MSSGVSTGALQVRELPLGQSLNITSFHINRPGTSGPRLGVGNINTGMRYMSRVTWQ